MRRHALILVAVLSTMIGMTGTCHAYSYAAAGAEPLLDGREALFSAASAGDWAGAQKALEGMKADLDYLDGHEDPGISKAFADALAAKDPALVKAAFVRAASAEIERRINGARDNLGNYQTAKVLVVRAQRFYTAIAADLTPEASAQVKEGLEKALDAVGNPGVFGVGARKPDPAAFAAARTEILEAVGRAS